MTRFQKRLWWGLLVLAVASPLGILLPLLFDAEEPWGEWSSATLHKALGYVPEGLKHTADIWKVPLPGYGTGSESASVAVQAVWYVVSALVGILLLGLSVYLMVRLITKHAR